MDKKTLSKYRCFYCTSPTYKTDEYSEIVEHCVKGHKCQTLKYRELILQGETGLLKYQSKSHEGIIPIRLENEGKTIEVRGSQTFITRTTPKRKSSTLLLKTSWHRADIFHLSVKMMSFPMK
ncbi:hypothetical protein DPMN_138419 [Dreissena polymorpha]|uniref:Uncharacterized protein n=1 Tax=Dreissena polymorpha TaxID=45954 RepID=A0A9D4JJT5_DREPO|nr:hypothetical protein DPMN_138419 [Dreissena polymorpha]